MSKKKIISMLIALVLVVTTISVSYFSVGADGEQSQASNESSVKIEFALTETCGKTPSYFESNTSFFISSASGKDASDLYYWVKISELNDKGKYEQKKLVCLGKYPRPYPAVSNGSYSYTGNPITIIRDGSGVIGENDLNAHFEYQVIQTNEYLSDYSLCKEEDWIDEIPTVTNVENYRVFVRLSVTYNEKNYYFNDKYGFNMQLAVNRMEYNTNLFSVKNFNPPQTYAETQVEGFSLEAYFNEHPFDVYYNETPFPRELYSITYDDASDLTAGESNSPICIEIPETETTKGKNYFLSFSLKYNEANVTIDDNTDIELIYAGEEISLTNPIKISDGDGNDILEENLSIPFYTYFLKDTSNGEFPDDFWVEDDGYERPNDKYYADLMTLSDSFEKDENQNEGIYFTIDKSYNSPKGLGAGIYLISIGLPEGNLEDYYPCFNIFLDAMNCLSSVEYKGECFIARVAPKDLSKNEITFNFIDDSSLSLDQRLSVIWNKPNSSGVALVNGTDYTTTYYLGGKFEINFKGNYRGCIRGVISDNGNGTYSVNSITKVLSASDKDSFIDAIANAEIGDTIELSANIDVSENNIIIPDGVTLNLNGKNLTAYDIFVEKSGCIIDTSKTKGVVSASMFSLSKAQMYLPIYNNGGYSFFNLGVKVINKTSGENTMYGFYIDTSLADYQNAVALIKKAGNNYGNIDATVTYRWTNDSDSNIEQVVVFSNDKFDEYLENTNDYFLTTTVSKSNVEASTMYISFGFTSNTLGTSVSKTIEYKK